MGLDRLVQFSQKWSLIPVGVRLVRIDSKQGLVVVELGHDAQVGLLVRGHFPDELSYQWSFYHNRLH